MTDMTNTEVVKYLSISRRMLDCTDEEECNSSAVEIEKKTLDLAIKAVQYCESQGIEVERL